jgi:signal transduction histidine kinase
MGSLGGGLYLLDGGNLVGFAVRDGLYDDEIYGIAADAQDRLWMACSRGVFSVNRADLRSFAAGRTRSFVSTPFSPTDALRTIECRSGVQPAAWSMRDGQLWFSTIRGIIVIDPKLLERRSPPPPARLEEVLVNGKSEDAVHIGDLPPGRTNLEFRYTGMSLLSPGRMTFRYRLDGFDRDWVEAESRRQAIYTNLPPGRYQFHVAARNLDGSWGKPADSAAFVLTPHIYQRAWFLPVCIAALLWAAWVAYRQRIRRMREKIQAVVDERSRIARELHDTLIQGFSGVTMEMQALATRLPPASEQRSAMEEIIRDAGNSLREARRSVAGLRSVHGTDSELAQAIEQAARQLTEATDVRLRLRLQPGPRNLAPDIEYNLLRIAQEAIANAVRHSGAGLIEVALACEGESLQLLVRDNGCGFDARDGNSQSAGHYGLTGMRERARQIGAELHLESSPGAGTTVRVDLATGAKSTGPPPEGALPAATISGADERGDDER